MARVAVREKPMARTGGASEQARPIELTDRDVELLLRRLSQSMYSVENKPRLPHEFG